MVFFNQKMYCALVLTNLQNRAHTEAQTRQPNQTQLVEEEIGAAATHREEFSPEALLRPHVGYHYRHTWWALWFTFDNMETHRCIICNIVIVCQ